VNTYVAGTSWLHRLPVAAKLFGLVVLLAATFTLDSPLAVGTAALAAVLLYVSAGLTRAVPAQVWPMRWLVLGLFGLQALAAGWVAALVMTGRLVVAVVLAGLLTLTTRVVDLLDVLERLLRPMRRAGVDAARTALMLALAIRAVPIVAGLAAEVLEAQRARGLGPSPRAFGVPFVVRSMRHADALGEALAARGLDDQSSAGEAQRDQ
jgi:biotin transport system permease protein